LAENYPNSSQVQNYLARAYKEYQNYFDAAKTFENAAALSGVPEEKAKLLGDAAVQYIKAGFQVDSDETLKKLKAMLINAEMRESEFLGFYGTF
jgi:predicted Zn-dependent protease